jgi:hypothetical protein
VGRGKGEGRSFEIEIWRLFGIWILGFEILLACVELDNV